MVMPCGRPSRTRGGAYYFSVALEAFASQETADRYLDAGTVAGGDA
ncbi:hypothetical protein L284_21140 [Novosphingobium lindaniclasticum LE124]|uniref:Uncharacterized protein n=1 Tax=Novosphingobium lindaniclasticum LE124 TaxID=1096930 RepID=T0H687_9SPHN|nr:hypothetical protein L284_21140 [Novosphingobium lindaniclasticum LE124]